MNLKATTAERIKQIMEEENLRQVDVIEKAQSYCDKYHISLSKANLSMYLSGKSEPAQDKLYLLSKVFGVSEAWLMGCDVPRKDPGDVVDVMPAWMAAFSGAGYLDPRVAGFLQYLNEQAEKEMNNDGFVVSEDEKEFINAYRNADEKTREIVTFALGLKRGE